MFLITLYIPTPASLLALLKIYVEVEGFLDAHKNFDDLETDEATLHLEGIEVG